MKNKNENSDYFLDGDKIHYSNKCMHCINNCKQSFRADVICCPKYEDRQK